METWTEKIQVAGERVVKKIRELVKEGNVRKIIIKKPNGDVLREIPLTSGVAIGGLAIWLAPILAALGAIVAMGMDYTIEVVRTDGGDGQERSESSGGADTDT